MTSFAWTSGAIRSTEEGLVALDQAPAADPSWGGPYLKKPVPLDPWGKPYVYVVPGVRGDVDITSLGRDGRAGGTGEDADVTN